MAQSNNTVIVYPYSTDWISAVSQFSAKFKIILSGAQTSNLLTIVEDLIYNSPASRHQIHTREDETITVLNGSLQVYLNGYQFCAPAGTTFYIPRNTTQSQRTLSSKPIHVQISFTPSGLENYLYQITPYLLQPVMNQTAADIIAMNNGLVFLPEVTWQNLSCDFNGDGGAVVASGVSRKILPIESLSVFPIFSLLFCFFDSHFLI